MGFTPGEKIRSKRDRNFRSQVVASLNALEEASKKRGRVVRIINSPFFILLLTFAGSFAVFYYSTYTRCISDTRQFLDDHLSLKMELYARENEIAAQILEARSISELRKKTNGKKYTNPKYKEFSTSELQTLFAIQSSSIDESGIDNSAEAALRQSPLYQKYGHVLHGIISDNIKDADLKEIKQFAAQTTNLNFARFLTDLRTITEVQCIPSNVLLMMLGEKPLTVQRYDAGSFVKKERQRLRSMSGRNLLTPRIAPPPFPNTTYRPSSPSQDHP